jgi:hypothetical protein
MKNKILLLVLVIIGILGACVRYHGYIHQHPDNDELYELKQMVHAPKPYSGSVNFLRVFDNSQSYGDHSPFPGEYLLYWPFIQRDWGEVEIDIGARRLNGLGLKELQVRMLGFKPFLCLVSLILFGLICYKIGWGGVVAFLLFCFNNHIVYHAVSMRYYSVLPLLAIVSYVLCRRDTKWFYHSAFVFFCCIYHAFGPLIALLPVICFGVRRNRAFWLCCVFSLICWGYYLSGMSSGGVKQAVLDPFVYMPSNGYVWSVVQAFTGCLFFGGLFTYAVTPLLFIGFRFRRFFGCMILLPLCVVTGMAVIVKLGVHPRYMIWIMPWFFIWVGEVVEELFYGSG